MPNSQLGDFLFFNGRITTLNPALPSAEALLVRRGRIGCVGETREVERAAVGDVETVDLGSRTVVPGFIDSHTHLLTFGQQRLRSVELRGCESVDALLDRLAQKADTAAGWVVGRGFDQQLLASGRYPTRAQLDRISNSRPILISRVCGHAVVVNSAAIQLLSPAQQRAGDPDGGLFTEQAAAPLFALIPELTEAEQDAAGLLAAAEALRTGITTVQTMLDAPAQLGVWNRLARRGQLPIRIVAMPMYGEVETLHRHGIATGFGDERVRIGAAKLFADGSLGARTALLAEPYDDDPSTCGVRMYPPDQLKQFAKDAREKGFQLTIHAIGDQALRETIDAVEFAMAGAPEFPHRHRIEHVSLCPPAWMDRMANLGITAAIQPQFVTSDPWTPRRIGPTRAQWAYPFASLLKAGVSLALGSDCPVETLDAFACLRAAVERHEWSPLEVLTIHQALDAYCLGSARAGGVDNDVGSLEVGKCADFVVLSEPILHEPARLKNCRALATYVGGECCYRDEDSE